MLELVAGGAVGLAALAIVLEPLLRRMPVRPADAADDEPIPLEESESPKIQALLALKEIEFDRATGKLAEDDYERLKATYSAAALAAMEAEKAVAGGAGGAGAADPSSAADALIERARAGRRCPEHGTRPELDAVFCSECGATLAT